MTVAVRLADLVEAPLLADFQHRVALVAYASIFPPEAPLPDPAQMALDWRRRLSGAFAPNQVGYVAELSGQLAGVVIASGDPEMPTFGHITRLYVEPGVWGRGVGRCLYDCAVAHLQEVGYEQASLWVLENNERARSWYERLGWSCTGERKPVYGLAGIDDVRYTLELGTFGASDRGGRGQLGMSSEFGPTALTRIGPTS
jgi:ribosomal protein S18 acetylase RimI-like enzyme